LMRNLNQNVVYLPENSCNEFGVYKFFNEFGVYKLNLSKKAELVLTIYV
jgi:hypothetical protein